MRSGGQKSNLWCDRIHFARVTRNSDSYLAVDLPAAGLHVSNSRFGKQPRRC